MSLQNEIEDRSGHEPEFMQAVEEVAHSVGPFIEKTPKYRNKQLLRRMIEPERVIMFRVCWVDDRGEIQVNRGYRIEMNSAIGPYKGELFLGRDREKKHKFSQYV